MGLLTGETRRETAIAWGFVVVQGVLILAILLLAAGGLVGWFMAKARWQEGRLRARYRDYGDYAARTPRFVPLSPVGADRR